MRQTAHDENNSFLIKAFEKGTAIFVAANAIFTGFDQE
jgi:hypothetical protein